jgi:hypothetical protein
MQVTNALARFLTTVADAAMVIVPAAESFPFYGPGALRQVSAVIRLLGYDIRSWSATRGLPKHDPAVML